MASGRIYTQEVNTFVSLSSVFAFSPSLPLPLSLPQQPGMNLPGHVEPCQSEAQLAIHHTALAACHCRHGVFLLCVCERDGCSPAVRAPHQRHVHLHPRGPPVKTKRRPFALPRSDSSPWMDGRNGDRE
ncbi:hypothetical protein EXN66_Car006150 [Channa argus]|uniref:Uncharacterized protein n=1 Tax=Channa argus TaxID=215402 RepID=A0A6G1PJR7_CHAAH|nr:hypothetical protein EXN66_Car006150 [Channa argus]